MRQNRKLKPVADLSASAQRVLLYVLLNDYDRCIELIPTRVEAFLGSGDETVRNGIKELKAAGFVEHVKGTKYAYRVCYPQQPEPTALDSMRADYGRFARETY